MFKMDIRNRTPEAFSPYMGYPYCSYVTPSPTPSLCNENVLKFPFQGGMCASKAVQAKTSAGMVSCKQSTDINNFFQAGVGFSDVSESGESAMQGNPCFQFFQVPQRNANTFQYQTMEKPSWHPMFENTGHNQQFITQGDAQKKQAYKITIDSKFSGQDRVNQGSSETSQYSRQNDTSKHIVKSQKIVHSESSRSEAKVGNEGKTTRKSFNHNRSRELISTMEVKKDLSKQKKRKKAPKKNKSLHKTEFCTHWTLTGKCKFKERCYFAHGLEELKMRSRVGNFKTRPCLECPSEKGRCMFGVRCNYCHPGEAIRRAVGSLYFDAEYYYNLKKGFPNNDCPFGLFV